MPYKICLKNPTENTNLYGYLFSIWQISLTSHSIFCRIWVLCLYYLNNHSSISAWLQLHKVWKNIHLTTHTWFSLSEYLQLVYRTSNTRSNDTWILSADDGTTLNSEMSKWFTAFFLLSKTREEQNLASTSPGFFPHLRWFLWSFSLIFLRLHLCKTIVLRSEATMIFNKCRGGKGADSHKVEVRRVLFACQPQASSALLSPGLLHSTLPTAGFWHGFPTSWHLPRHLPLPLILGVTWLPGHQSFIFIFYF